MTFGEKRMTRCAVPLSDAQRNARRLDFIAVAGACAFLIVCILLSSVMLLYAAQARKSQMQDARVDPDELPLLLTNNLQQRESVPATHMTSKVVKKPKNAKRPRLERQSRQLPVPLRGLSITKPEQIEKSRYFYGDILCIDYQILGFDPVATVRSMPNECTYQFYTQMDYVYSHLKREPGGLWVPELSRPNYFQYMVNVSQQGIVMPRIVHMLRVHYGPSSWLAKEMRDDPANFPEMLVNGIESLYPGKKVQGLHLFVENVTHTPHEDSKYLVKLFRRYLFLRGWFFSFGFTTMYPQYFNDTLEFMFNNTDLVIYHVANSSVGFPEPWDRLQPYAFAYHDWFKLKPAIERLVQAKLNWNATARIPVGVFFDIWPRQCMGNHTVPLESGVEPKCRVSYNSSYLSPHWSAIWPAADADEINYYYGYQDQCQGMRRDESISGVTVETQAGIELKIRETMSMFHAAEMVPIMGVEPLCHDDQHMQSRRGNNPFTMAIAAAVYNSYNFTDKIRTRMWPHWGNPASPTPPWYSDPKTLDEWRKNDYFYVPESVVWHCNYGIDN